MLAHLRPRRLAVAAEDRQRQQARSTASGVGARSCGAASGYMPTAINTPCGSGFTACILGFMIEQLGNPAWRLYDGSWHEWGQHKDVPKLVNQSFREGRT